MRACYPLLVAALSLAAMLTEAPLASACGRRARRCRQVTYYPCAYWAPVPVVPDNIPRWNFQVGRPFYQEVTTESEQNMQIQGNRVDNKQSQTFVYSYTPKRRDADGNWLIIQKIEAVKMDFNIGSSKVSYDSTKGRLSGLSLLDLFFTADPLKDYFKALIGAEFQMLVDKRGRVLKFDGTKDLISRMLSSSSQQKAILKEIVNEGTLTQEAKHAFVGFPDGNLKLGDDWERGPDEWDMGPMGLFEINFHYTYDGQDRDNPRLDRISTKMNLKYRAPSPNVPGLPFKIASSDIQTTKSKGVIFFDRSKGRMESSESEMDLKGKLNIEIAGMITSVDLTQTQKTTIKNMDKNPVEPWKK